MTILAKVQNGVLTLPPDAPSLPEGAVVQVIVPELRPESPVPAPGEQVEGGALGWMLKYAGCVEGLPGDLADEHDHYIHGTPRRKPKP